MKALSPSILQSNCDEVRSPKLPDLRISPWSQNVCNRQYPYLYWWLTAVLQQRLLLSKFKVVAEICPGDAVSPSH